MHEGVEGGRSAYIGIRLFNMGMVLLRRFPRGISRNSQRMQSTLSRRDGIVSKFEKKR